MKQIDMEKASTLVAQGAALSPSQRGVLAQERLRELVEYVREKSPFFRDLYKHLPSNFSLSHLPPTTKEELQNHFDSWVTDDAVTHAALQAHIEQDYQKGEQRPFLDKYTVIATSGSTGVPFTMLRDDYHNRIHGALVSQRLMGRCGAAFSPVENRIAAVIVAKPSVSSYASFLRTQKAAGKYGENMLAVNISQPIEEIVKALNAFAPTTLTGYPSVLVALAQAQNEGKLRLKLRCVASSAEMLSDKAFDYISTVFGCPVVNNYCMTEGGEIAMSDGSCAHLHLNDDWILVEPIDADGNPAPKGSYSEGALITDLSNYICPIIRYRVSDRILLDASTCNCGSTLPILHIAGRIIGCFTLCGTMFYPYGFMEDLSMLKGVVDFQLARVEKDTLAIRLTVEQQDSFPQAAASAKDLAQKQLAACKIHGAKLQVTHQTGKNSEKTGKRQVVIDEVK